MYSTCSVCVVLPQLPIFLSISWMIKVQVQVQCNPPNGHILNYCTVTLKLGEGIHEH